jgi:hypothetical protein
MYIEISLFRIHTFMLILTLNMISNIQLSGVSMGAIGAHGMKNKDEAQKDMFKVLLHINNYVNIY